MKNIFIDIEMHQGVLEHAISKVDYSIGTGSNQVSQL